MGKSIKLILFFLGLSILFALIYRVGFSEIIGIVARAKLYFIFLGVLVYLLAILTRSLKWFLLTKLVKKEINYRQFLPFYLVNSLMGNLTPFKSGEAVTPFLFRKYLKIPVGQGFSIVVLDRFFELIVFAALLILALLFILNSGIQDDLILAVFKGALIVIFLLITVLIGLCFFKKIVLKIVRLFAVLRFLGKELDVFYNTLPFFKKTYQFLLPLTLISWFLEILASYLVYTSIFSVSFTIVAISLIITLGATLVTFIPGGVGISEVSIVYILNLFGYSPVFVTSGVLLTRFFLTGALLSFGFLGLIFIKRGEGNDSKRR